MRMQLGWYATDLITGFKGLVMGRSEYLSGCTQVLLIPSKVNKDGKRPDGEWFDEQRLVREGTKVLVLDNEKTPGADIEAPKR
jgi:hypothetical protein